MKQILLPICLLTLSFALPLHTQAAGAQKTAFVKDKGEETDFNPFDPKAEETLKAMDAQYEKETGRSANIATPKKQRNPLLEEATVNPQPINLLPPGYAQQPVPPYVPAQPDQPGQPPTDNPDAPPACRRMDCHIFIDVEKSTQTLNLYVDGALTLTTATSTGRTNFDTPDFDTNPNGRIYQIYSSNKYPGYNNMPFAVFIKGGFAIHGAPGAEESLLGQKASHGCVR
ncbi:MAG: L,D-transpeptidase family protein, partial [Pseudobdellovibrio sp.]